jgi:signal transduction histidine kinase
MLGFVLGVLGARATLRRPGSAHAALIVVLFASSVALMWAQPDGPGSVGVLVSVLFFNRLLPGRVAVTLSVVAFVALAVVEEVTGKGPGLALLAFLGGFVGMVSLASRLGEANEQAERLLVTAVALSQTTAQLVGSGATNEILAIIARHAVEGTRAVAAGTVLAGDDHKLTSGGGYGPGGPDYGEASPAWNALAANSSEEVIEAMTGGAIAIGDVPGKPVVLADARSAWEASPVMKGFAATLREQDWQGAVCVPLSWENRVFGLFGVYLPSGMAGPSEAELAFYTALADQAAVAVTNARLTAQAGQAAALLERARLARELHDSVSQALFSMTMHARAAQLSLAKAGLDETGPLARSIAQLGELTRGALAEMRALIFELRPGALAEEGVVDALRKQGAALTARE